MLKRLGTGDGAPPFVALMMPVALFFVAVPLPIVSLRTINTFREVADNSENGSLRFAAGTALQIARAFWDGAVGALMTIVVAFVIDRRRRQHASDATVEPLADAPAPSTTWRGWIIGAAALLTVPVGWLVWYVGGVGAFVLEAALLFEPATAVTPANLQSQVAYWSGQISSRLVTGLIGGAIAAVLLLALAFINLTIVRSARISNRASTIAHGVIGLTVVALVVHLARLGFALRSYAELIR